MPDYPDIWFLRHGQTLWNLEGRIQGRLDSDLTTQGKAQAAQQATLIAPIVPRVLAAGGAVYVSPLGRAQATAEIAMPGTTFEISQDLAEVGTGDWEGCLKSELPHAGTDLDIYAAAPGGEGFDELEARVRRFLARLRAPAIVVSHGLLGQVMRGLICNLDRPAMATLPNRQGCVFLLSNGEETLLETPQ
ncbi:histidine phosphatase family protein [Roseovarius pelagicus]|uniref:Histidine phosphatase family protein n=1 Tax=Roseovarius pelagicus TaxID=2980108 RepID=A0ABY6DBY5_9RHOB|nr:histidine phosphatase family protein [Roseovarius pelagicus]UXX83669.1 histidine phosphatase family protein [Roseovarius pelagicus]